MSPRWRRFLRRALWSGAALTVGVVLTVIVLRALPHEPLRRWLPSSTAVHDREGNLLRLALARDDRYRVWVPLEEMSPRLIEAVMLQEDRWFYWHPGFNPASLARGAWVSYVAGGARQGGSTLTMQLARLLWRLDTRSPRGKFVQVLRAVMLEAQYSKHDLLEAYLNYAPYGGNIEGVGAASLIYFGKRPADLNLPEVLTLAVLPQNPSRRVRAHAAEEDAPLSDALRDARDRLYARWQERHPADAAQAAQFALPLSLRSTRALPFAAPHFVETVLGERLLRPQSDAMPRTTLDSGLQRLLETRVTQYLQRTRQRGLDNAAVILVDTRDMGVRALMGSADYFDATIAGQVNGTEAKRSPGSTLKPFIYALAMDQGVIHPASVLRDVPTSFGPFTPENFDGRFVGPITATEALVRSRNVPAVAVAAQLNSPSFYDFLRRAQISRMASEQHYGLALVLGGGEVTMAELARLYAMLSNDGVLKPLRHLESDPIDAGTPLLSAEASYLAREMLRTNPRPDLAAAAKREYLPVAWKTGTSWGFRDAWTAGIVGPYVLVVWMGHFDGSGNPSLIGVEAAAPLFFELVDALAASGVALDEPARRWPLRLKRVEICRASGDLPNTWCPQRGDTWFIPGKSPIRVSQVHRAVAIDLATGLPACPPVDPRAVRYEVFEFWSSDLSRVFAQAGIPRRKPPVNPACPQGAIAGTPPRIDSPHRATTYTLRLNHPEQSRITLSAHADADVREIYWFIDDNFIARTEPSGTAEWSPADAGRYRIRAVDDHGRADWREVEVAVSQ